MGYLTNIKHFAPLVLYLAGLLFFLFGIFGRGQFALLLVIFLIPLRNIVEKVQEFPLGNQMIDILIAGAVFGWLGSSISKKKQIFAPSTLNMTIVILVFYMFLSLLLGNNYLNGSFFVNLPEVRLQNWKNFCLMPLLFFICLNYFKEKIWIYRALAVMGLAMILMEYYTVTQISWYSALISREKIHGTFEFLGPNEVAAFFNEYTVILMGIFSFIKEKRIKWLLLIMICANIYCILFLYSRGAYMGLMAGMALIFLFKNRKLLIPLVFVALFWQAILPAQVIERIKQTTGEYGQLDESSQRRISIWEYSLELFQKNPLVGIGLDVFPFLGLDLGDTHNIYVKYLVEQGLVGIAIFLTVIFCFLRMGYVLYKKGEDDLSKGMGLGLMACIVTLIVNNCFGNRWTYLEISAYLWIFAGLVGRFIVMAKNPEPSAEAQQSAKTTPAATEEKYKKKLRYYDI